MAEPSDPPSPSNPNRRFTIGYALAPKKQQSFIRQTLLTQAESRSITFIKIDPSKPLPTQGPFDCVIHKLYGDDWKTQLSNFHSLYPSSPVIDSPSAIERLHNRISMLQAVSELKKQQSSNPQPSYQNTSYPSFGIPKQIVIYDSETLNDPRSWEFLKFPVIAKPLVADGSAKSHKMSLVYTPTALTNLKPPIVLQEFVNHGGVIFKVYVVGEFVKCVKRKSLPDVSEEKVIESVGGIVTFSQVSNLASNQKTDEKYYKMMQIDDCEMPPQKFIADIAKGLREALKLNLFNFDVIRDTKLGNRYLVIDINYFPGYAKMPNYESVMIDFFWNLLAKNEKGEQQQEGKSEEKKNDDNGVE